MRRTECACAPASDRSGGVIRGGIKERVGRTFHLMGGGGGDSSSLAAASDKVSKEVKGRPRTFCRVSQMLTDRPTALCSCSSSRRSTTKEQSNVQWPARRKASPRKGAYSYYVRIGEGRGQGKAEVVLIYTTNQFQIRTRGRG